MSERLLLGACLYDAGQFAAVRGRVDGSMFQAEAHRLVWQAMCKVTDDGAVLDPPTVIDHLARTGDQLAEVGGPNAVHDLYAGVTAANAPHYADRVAEDARRRSTAAAARQGVVDLEAGGDVDEVLAEITAAARGKRGKGAFAPSDLASKLDDLLAGRHGAVWSTGWPRLDRIWRPAPGTLTVVTGVPGAGKSTMLDPVALSQVHQGRRIAVWSPEQAPVEDHLRGLLWAWHGRDPADMDPTVVAETLTGWDGKVTLLDPDDTTLPSVLARAEGIKATSGLDVLLIDPWNKLAHAQGDRRQDLYLQEQLGRLTRFARSSGVAVWVVAHPTKLQRMPGTDTCWQPPTIYDISGGAEWANQADVVVTVWRDAMGERSPRAEVMVLVGKVRRAQWGRTGKCMLRFDEGTRAYAEIDQVPL